ncbi:hypothetical protein AYI68_g1328 [Smittium mucronatum]|uniref:Chitin-binding type-4 domain-containing protein n=1 Tax=Smittium mucronatum TaxID=133383 RepID=A0A1R0H5U0_9FUNG|nr:hypothetical protein AYI68_g1328 [Smittium mucronatum]
MNISYLRVLLVNIAPLIITLFQIESVNSHGILGFPPSRGNLKWFGTCGSGQGCKGPCDSSISESINSLPFRLAKIKPLRRRSKMTVTWGRLNHPGGFVRISIVPRNVSDSWSEFDSNVVQYSCYEATCGPTVKNDPILGFLNGGGNAECSAKIKIPGHLHDGIYTLQWAWFGGGVYMGDVNKSFGEYYGCSDFVVKGGPPPSSRVKSPKFVGGDVMYPSENVCRYWGSNKLGDCSFKNKFPKVVPGNPYESTLEPCMGGGAKKGKPAGF